jgi:tetratricopeptide (TPR) repeat protein
MHLYTDSEAQYQAARQLNPRAVVPLINLGSLFIAGADVLMKSREDPMTLLRNARTVLEESLKLKPSSLGYYFLGMAYYKSGSYDEAEPNLKHALEMTPYPPAVRLMLANVYMKLQEWPNALEHLDAYLLENPRAADRSAIQDTRTKVIQRLK